MGIILSILNLFCHFLYRIVSALGQPQVYAFGGKMMLSISRTGGPSL